MTKSGVRYEIQSQILYWLDVAWQCHIAALRTRDLCALTGVPYNSKHHSSMRVT